MKTKKFRNYKNYSIKEASAIIATEVIQDGVSNGWSGSLGSEENLDSIKELLNKYNIKYVDDLNGGWELRSS